MLRFATSVDIGGTFTDFVLQDRERRTIFTEKVLTTPHAPEDAIFVGLDLLSQRSEMVPGACDLLLHATTIITNAVIERKGRDFILFHTDGFRTTLETGREHRYNLTNLKLRFPEPLTKDGLKLAVAERVSATGEIVVTPSREAVIGGIERLVDQTGVKNFAVCFLHSYRNGANEEAVRGWILERFPDAYVSTSASVAPAQREYERWMTCAVNAHTMPILADYLGRLARGLTERGFGGRGLMMTSSGLPLSFDHCVQYPVRLIESGPAAGVLAAREIAARNPGGSGNVLAYDMGGTTAKGAFLTAGEAHVQSTLEVARVGAFEVGSGFPLMIPAIDLIGDRCGRRQHREHRRARRDRRRAGQRRRRSRPRLLRPRRHPGDADGCQPGAGIPVGGQLPQQRHRRQRGARPQGHSATIADPLGISVERAALGIHHTVNENVARAFRVHAAELAIDYRRYSLVCTGGSSSLHALAIARILNISRVIFPFGAGVPSAFGAFAGREGIALQRTKLLRLDRVTRDDVTAQVDEMIAGGTFAVSLAACGATASLTIGMRYEGQGYETAVKLGSDRNRYGKEAIRAAFEAEYRKIFGLIFPDYTIELVYWTVEIANDHALSDLDGYSYENVREAGVRDKGTRLVVAHRDGAWTPVPVINRYALRAGDIIAGEALIEENDTTIYIPAGSQAVVSPALDLVVRMETKA